MLEAFVRGCSWLEADERNRALLVTGEIFDNLVKHARGGVRGRIVVRISKRRETTILFLFNEPGFAAFAANHRERKPFFDPTLHRYRGLGVIMCERLSRRIHFHPGSRRDAIVVTL